MEPDHPFVIARLAGVFLCALPAARELYQYINDPRYGTGISLFLILCFSGLSWCPNRLTFFTRSCALRKTVRMGQHVWLMLATIGTELLVIIKWSKGQFPTPLPAQVWFGWLVGAAILVLYPVGQVGSHPTTTLVSGRFLGRLTCGSCSTCSSAYPAPGDIYGGILASQESRLSNRALGFAKYLFILYAMSHHLSHVYILYLYKPSNVSGVWRIALYEN
jgi:hypothetical protein